MSTSDRSFQEQVLTDQGDVYKAWYALKRRYSHIFESPNTMRNERVFRQMLCEAVSGKRVLEIGCGTGSCAVQASQCGATSVLAVDISRTRIAQARQRDVQGTVEFQVADVAQPIEGAYDVIVGRAVLHHLDYREVLQRLVRENLNAHGMMIFYEPLGSNVLIRLFHTLSRDAHTPDEHPFEHDDLAWLHTTFPDFALIPINYLSLPLGAISPLLFKRPDNVMLHAADHIDDFLARHVSWLHHRFRAAIFVIRNP
jgi:SAM-dependent methyltransferase